MNRKFSLLFFSTFLFLYGCNQDANRSGGQPDGIATALPWVKLEDAKKIMPSWSKENTVVYHIIAEPADLHPTNGNTATRSEINLYTQMFLINTDFKDGGIATGLVKALPVVSADGLQYTYELREQPAWDNGEKLKLEDVLFTFKAIKCPLTNNPSAKTYWENLKEVITYPNEPGKFTMIMKRPYIQNIAFLTDYPVLQRSFFDPHSILSHYSLSDFNDTSFHADLHKDLIDWSNEFNNEKYGHDPSFMNGLGMYRVENWEQGQFITLVKKKNHWTRKSADYHEAAYPDKIIFKINRDDNSQMLEFKSQAMDASANLSPKVLMSLRENEEFNTNYNSLFTMSYNYVYMAMNERPDNVNHRKIFDDVKVRHAMAYLTPVDNILKFIYKNYSGQTRRLASNVTPLKKDCDLSLEPVPFDLGKADKLLDEAGWKDTDGDGIRDKIVEGTRIPLRFTFQYLNTASDWKDMAAMAAEQMEKAGAKVDLLPLDPKVFVEKARNHDFDLMLGVWGGTSFPEDFTQLWHSKSWTSKGSNYSGFGSAESDALIDSLKITLDAAKHNEMSKRLQRIIYVDQPYVFLYGQLRRIVVHKRFGNVTVYSERPGILLNTFRLLSGSSGTGMKDGDSPH